MMGFGDTSPSASWSDGFLNKVAIPGSNKLSPDLLAYPAEKSMSLDLRAIVPTSDGGCVDKQINI